MVEVPVGDSHVALVDDADAALVRRHSWRLLSARGGLLKYAQTTAKKRPHRYTLHMHRLVMGLPKGDRITVDHINHNGLDNRRANLRLATRYEQNHNRRQSLTVGAPFKGVKYNRRTKRYEPRIMVKGTRHYLGGFATAEEAAMRYNVAARKYHGEFAFLNHVEMG